MKYTLLIVLSFFATVVFAEGRVDAQEVEFVRIDASGKGFVKFKSPLSGEVATCTQTDYTNTLAFNANTEAGKAFYSAMLVAFSSQKKVTARGSGACGLYPVMEDYLWGYIH